MSGTRRPFDGRKCALCDNVSEVFNYVSPIRMTTGVGIYDCGDSVCVFNGISVYMR